MRSQKKGCVLVPCPEIRAFPEGNDGLEHKHRGLNLAIFYPLKRIFFLRILHVYPASWRDSFCACSVGATLFRRPSSGRSEQRERRGGANIMHHVPQLDFSTVWPFQLQEYLLLGTIGI